MLRCGDEDIGDRCRRRVTQMHEQIIRLRDTNGESNQTCERGYDTSSCVLKY